MLGSLAAAPAAARTAGAAPGHNVLFLMADEHSAHAVGCFGNQTVRTPAIDSLAAGGAAFAAAYCQNPICVPSRASILTGRMPSNVGVFGNAPNCLDDGVTTIAEVFRRAGYVTAWMGKTHWGGASHFDAPRERDGAAAAAQARRAALSRLPSEARIAEWPVSEEPDTFTRLEALRFLERHRGQRFFAGVSFRKPHFPFVVQEPYHRMYEGRVAAPRVTREMIEALPLVSQRERQTYGFARLTEAQIRRAREIYYGMVSYIDDQVKEILARLEALGMREQTIVLYTADHGEMAGEHGLWYKNAFYEAAARVPLVLSAPGAMARGRTIAAPVMNMDLFPTLCELCGVAAPAGLEGRSLVPLLKGSEGGGERYALSENFRANSASRMIRTARWKYCYFDGDREQLFDMAHDRGEEHNLADRAEHRGLVASLRQRALEGWRREGVEEYRRKARQSRAAGEPQEP